MNRGSTARGSHGKHNRFCFNEAPIHESGKSRLARCAAANGVSASMRPRFMNRGSHQRHECRVPDPASFNEAPIHESGKCYAIGWLDEYANAASMRPRFMNRGSARLNETGYRHTTQLQ